MNIEKSKRIICISLLTLILLLSSIGCSYAATRSELNDIDQKIEQTNTESGQIEYAYYTVDCMDLINLAEQKRMQYDEKE